MSCVERVNSIGHRLFRTTKVERVIRQATYNPLPTEPRHQIQIFLGSECYHRKGPDNVFLNQSNRLLRQDSWRSRQSRENCMDFQQAMSTDDPFRLPLMDGFKKWKRPLVMLVVLNEGRDQHAGVEERFHLRTVLAVV